MTRREAKARRRMLRKRDPEARRLAELERDMRALVGEPAERPAVRQAWVDALVYGRGWRRS